MVPPKKVTDRPYSTESFDLHRGRAEQKPRISIPVPAVPVPEYLAGKKPENL